ncbi:MAG: 4'-phosphopantetheinyl transferase superfamily protein [Bryobacteraceae bacterium]
MMWRPAVSRGELRENEVHVWRAALDVSARELERLVRSLSEEEQARARRYIVESARVHFAAARGILRDILSRYLGLPPAEIRFTYGKSGKPALAGEINTAALRFNLSHSHGFALYAVTCGRETGIDIEKVRPEPSASQIAERFFSPCEAAALRELPPELVPAGFFLCWTRKEAYIKACGEGLYMNLKNFDVSLTPGEPAKLLAVRDDASEASRWSLMDLKPHPHYTAALAVEGAIPKLCLFDWRNLT